MTFLLTLASPVLAPVLACLLFFVGLITAEAVCTHLDIGRPSRFLLLVVKAMRRNPVRTLLAFLAVFVLVFVVTMVWSVLSFLDAVT